MGAFSALLGLAASVTSASATMSQPIKMAVLPEGEFVTIQVIAQGKQAEGLLYQLEVEGSSRLSQSGRAGADESGATLCNVRFSARAPWQARLRVHGRGVDYTVTRTSADR